MTPAPSTNGAPTNGTPTLNDRIAKTLATNATTARETRKRDRRRLTLGSIVAVTFAAGLTLGLGHWIVAGVLLLTLAALVLPHLA